MSDEPTIGMVRCGSFVAEEVPTPDRLTVIAIRHTYNHTELRLLPAEAPALLATLRAFLNLPSGDAQLREERDAAVRELAQLRALVGDKLTPTETGDTSDTLRERP